MKRLAVLLLLAAGASAAYPQAKRIYIANDDHTDLLWTATVPQYEQAFQAMIDYYLAQADATAANAPDSQGRFNLDGSYWLWVYEHARTPAEFARVIARLKDGHLSAPMTPLVILYGGVPAEAALRGMYYAGRLERREGLRFRLAVSMENQALPWGLASLWAGSGAAYSWKGICGCATRVANAGDREHDIYRYTGPDGLGVLMKWNTLLTDNESMGGYAEARDLPGVIDLVSTSAEFQARYPYPVIGCFGRGWDDLQTLTDAFVAASQTLSDASRRVIVSNETDFFEDFDANHGAALPTESRAYGNEWDLYAASLAEVSASVRRAAERLRAAEAMAAVVSLFDPAFLSGREAARDLAFMDLGLFWDHDWTANGPVPASEREAWQRQIAGEIAAYVDGLHADAAVALGDRIPAGGAGTRFFAFNPLGWERTDAADLPWSDLAPVHVVEAETGLEVPSQIVTIAGTRFLRILAAAIPPVGYRTYDILPGAGQAFGDAASVSAGVIENARYRVTVADRGAIAGLVDKTRGDVELAASVLGRQLNDLGPGGGALSVENAGPVSVTLRSDSPAPLQHTSRVTLFRDGERIDIANEITQNFSDVRTWGFGFNLASPQVRHEEVGAIARARTQSQGGDYSDRQARYDWLTLNHFADISGAGGIGATLSSADIAFFRLGDSTHTILDTATPLLSPLAGGQVDGPGLGIQAQGGDSRFVQRFALRVHGGYDPAAAMRFSLEHQNPLVAGLATGASPSLPPGRFSAISVSDPDVLLWAFKPAEEGIDHGLIARLWNVADAPRSAVVQIAPAPIVQASQTTHLESDEGALPVTAAGLAADFLRQQIRTFRLLPDPAGGLDSDGDGVPDTLDCSTGNAQVWAPPGEVPALQVAGDGVSGTSLSWAPPADPGATTLVYDTLRSSRAYDFVDGAGCVRWDDPATSAPEARSPVPPAVLYYLVRAENACPGGEGSLGVDSSGTPRAGTVCPSPTFDGDGDGFSQAADCDDGNGTAWAPPGEATALTLTHSRATGITQLAWTPPPNFGATAVVFDVLRAGTASGFASALCLESDDGANVTAVDAQAPPSRGKFFYLVRAQNACPNGEGTLGSRSNGQPRTGRSCP